ncbi:MAG: hypothetical protein ACFFDT_14915 [Candidatus Hodarchaeota archaeon]
MASQPAIPTLDDDSLSDLVGIFSSKPTLQKMLRNFGIQSDKAITYANALRDFHMGLKSAETYEDGINVCDKFVADVRGGQRMRVTYLAFCKGQSPCPSDIHWSEGYFSKEAAETAVENHLGANPDCNRDCTGVETKY